MEFPFYVYSNCMKMCDTERHQLTNEMRQTGFRAGFFPGLIGINCERLQSTTRCLTFASSERFLLIVLMITREAGDHHGRGRLPGAGLPGYLLQEGCASARLWGSGLTPLWAWLPAPTEPKGHTGNPKATLAWLWLKALGSHSCRHRFLPV